MSQRDKNRADFPNAAKVLDEFRQHFGEGVKLVYAAERGREIGNNTEPNGCLNSEQWLRLGQVGNESWRKDVKRK